MLSARSNSELIQPNMHAFFETVLAITTFTGLIWHWQGGQYLLFAISMAPLFMFGSKKSSEIEALWLSNYLNDYRTIDHNKSPVLFWCIILVYFSILIENNYYLFQNYISNYIYNHHDPYIPIITSVASLLTVSIIGWNLLWNKSIYFQKLTFNIGKLSLLFTVLATTQSAAYMLLLHLIEGRNTIESLCSGVGLMFIFYIVSFPIKSPIYSTVIPISVMGVIAIIISVAITRISAIQTIINMVGSLLILLAIAICMDINIQLLKMDISNVWILHTVASVTTGLLMLLGAAQSDKLTNESGCYVRTLVNWVMIISALLIVTIYVTLRIISNDSEQNIINEFAISTPLLLILLLLVIHYRTLF